MTTLYSLSFASSSQQRRKPPVPCHDEVVAVMDAIEAVYAKGEVTCHVSQIHKYLVACDNCLSQAKLERKIRKPSTLYYLTQYLDHGKNKVK